MALTPAVKKLRYAFRDAKGARKNVSLEDSATVKDLKEKIAAVMRIPTNWQGLLVGRPLKEVEDQDETKPIKDLIPSGTLITVRDNRPTEEEKTSGITPSVIKKALPKAKASKAAEKWTEEKRNRADEFKEGEVVIIVGLRDKAINGKECKIVKYDPNLNRWEVSRGEDDVMYLSPDHLQAKFVKKDNDGPGIITLQKGKFCTQAKDSHVVCKKYEDFTREWKRTLSKHKQPIVDFTQYTAAFLYQGERRSGGYEIFATSCEDKGDNVVVYYNVKLPKVHEKVSSGKTRPFHVVAIPKTPKPVKFIMRG